MARFLLLTFAAGGACALLQRGLLQGGFPVPSWLGPAAAMFTMTVVAGRRRREARGRNA